MDLRVLEAGTGKLAEAYLMDRGLRASMGKLADAFPVGFKESEGFWGLAFGPVSELVSGQWIFAS